MPGAGDRPFDLHIMTRPLSSHPFLSFPALHSLLVYKSERVIGLFDFSTDPINTSQHCFLITLEHRPSIVAIEKQVDLKHSREDVLRTAVDEAFGQFSFYPLTNLLGRHAPAYPAAIHYLHYHVLLNRAATHRK